jgi:hypothetical protein
VALHSSSRSGIDASPAPGAVSLRLPAPTRAAYRFWRTDKGLDVAHALEAALSFLAAVLVFNMLADGVRDWLDPQHTGRR